MSLDQTSQAQVVETPQMPIEGSLCPLWDFKCIFDPMSFEEVLDFVEATSQNSDVLNAAAENLPEGCKWQPGDRLGDTAEGALDRISEEIDEANVWLFYAVLVGQTKSKVAYGENFRKVVSEEFLRIRNSINRGQSEQFGISQSELGRYARIYSEIILPRITQQVSAELALGGDMGFPLYNRGYYVTACEFARKLKTPALRLLELAEERAADEAFSVSEFRQLLRSRVAQLALRESAVAEKLPFKTAWTNPGTPEAVSRFTRLWDGHYQHSLMDTPDDLPEMEWSLISTRGPTSGIYMAASGRAENLVGTHFGDSTQVENLVLDGELMSPTDAWRTIVSSAHYDGLVAPHILIFPEVSGAFSHRPKASGRMELLVLPFRVEGKTVGVLAIDYSDKRHLLLRSQQSYGFLRKVCEPLVEHLKTKTHQLFTGEEGIRKSHNRTNSTAPRCSGDSPADQPDEK